jgi:Tc toxin complex TcA C-terminal TcB-binding domain
MASTRYFHGMFDTYHGSLGHWVTERGRKYDHSVEHARHILYRFATHTHPYAQRLVWELITNDIDGLQRLDDQTDLRRTFFTTDYGPIKVVPEIDPALCADAPVGVLATRKADSTLPDDGLPVADLDFDYQGGAYSVYNWEVFYHAPFTIALHLSRNGRYAESQRWFHYIFDPTDNSDPSVGPKRFWKVKPFKIDEVDHIEQVLFNVATGDDPIERDSTVRAIGAWRDSPFRPHLVARSRPVAYMYATVMAYLDNLIAWGDSLFRQDTRESINEAMQLYVLAANILGPRPQEVPRAGSNKKQTYSSLKDRLDEFGNAAVQLESEVAFDLFPPPTPADTKPEQTVLESVGRSLYFCVPRNEQLISYWDTVADRLFKIHYSLNLQGVFRQLPLFAPPIDPRMLARAVAAGIDIGAIISGSATAIAPVRFQFLIQKALELAQEVQSLGAAILSALEKKDGETLGVIRARYEANMLGLVEAVKYAQWQESLKAREGIQVNLANAFQRFRHYDRLLGTADAAIKLPDYAQFDRSTFETRTNPLDEPSVDAADPLVRIGSSFRDGDHKVSPEEAHEIDLLEASQIVQEVATGLEATGAFLSMIPDVEAAAKPWGLGAGINFGGTQLGALMRGLTEVARGAAGRITHESMLAGKMGGFARREQDWALQRKAAAGELTQLFKQLRSAEIREYMAQLEHEHHLKQINQSKAIVEFLTNEQNTITGDQRKTTTEDFYLWMKREAQGLHAKSFQFAFDVAQKTERALQNELADPMQTFIGSGYLAGREGLLAGEKLYFDLKRMEMAFAENNRREFEITKNVSLAEWFPLKLIGLRESGRCEISIPESLFDLDCPGHGFRRIKAVALSIPCVVGPYASINAQLTLNESYVRQGAGGYGGAPQEDTTNFVQFRAAVTSVVTSTGQGDSGTFETNLNDNRYLPFEGAGAISTWNLELLGTPRSFDYETIADVVLTIRYTARPSGSGDVARATAMDWLKANAARVFSMRHEFATEWAAFKGTTTANGGKATLKFSLSKQHFPYRMESISEKAKQMHLFFAGDATGDVELMRGDKAVGTSQIVSGSTIAAEFDPTGDFELRFDSNALDDLWIVVDWSTDQV